MQFARQCAVGRSRARVLGRWAMGTGTLDMMNSVPDAADSTWQVHTGMMIYDADGSVTALSFLRAGLPEDFYFRDLCRRKYIVEVRHHAPFLECKNRMLHASARIFVVGIVEWSPIIDSFFVCPCFVIGI